MARRPAARTIHMMEYAAQNGLPLGAADDLPLFAGIPVRVTVRDFRPEPAHTQPTLIDIRPQFGERK